MKQMLVISALCAAAACGSDAAGPTETPPARVRVMPVFFVPTGRSNPTADQRTRLVQHINWARQRYVTLLGAAGEFIADTDGISVPPIVAGAHSGAYYAGRPEDGAPDITAELLAHFGVTRVTNPYVFVIVVMNPTADVPGGGGRPINGGFNEGGGIVLVSSFNLDSITHFQSTLRHELGHAFGLVHVDQYGRNMNTDSSMMSYNPAHHTNGFTDSPTPGTFSYEDRKALSLNQRVFAGLTYSGPVIPTLIGLPPMTLP